MLIAALFLTTIALTWVSASDVPALPADRLSSRRIAGVPGSVAWSQGSDLSGAFWSYSVASVTSITASIALVPPPGSLKPTSPWSIVAWIGIDADNCPTAFFQTGIEFDVASSGTVTSEAWYEWYPDYAYDYSGFALSVGDSVTLTLTVTGSTAGTATVTNNTKGKKVSKSFTSAGALCRQDAEWISQTSWGTPTPPPPTGASVVFTNAYLTVNNGTKVYPPGAQIVQASGSQVTTGPTSVTIKYV